MKKISFIILMAVFISSCEKEAKVKLPETKPLPVMYCYICPDDTVISLQLTQSQPLYNASQGDIFAPVKDANVTISGAQGSAQLVYDQFSQRYVLNTNTYSVGLGMNYKITVTMSNGDIATAETTVPTSTVGITNLNVDHIVEKNSSYDRIKIEFNDQAGVTNYYRMAGLAVATYTWLGPDTTYSDLYINEIYSDNGHDGEASQITGQVYEQFDSIPYYDIYLYNCSVSYYSYHRSIRNYTGANPFAEPTLVYSNVKGGFGCFAAYTRTRSRYKK
jgi:hypothetical protein